jgi:predicted membrane GTPase involved in stress response
VVQKSAKRDDGDASLGGVAACVPRPDACLIGYQGDFTDTRGAVMNRLFHDYGPYRGDM